MDYKDILFVGFLFFFYSLAITTYVAVGNTIFGEKVTQAAQFYNSHSKGFQEYYTNNKKSSKLVFPIYYLVFFVLVVASFFLMMSLRSTFRSWIDRMLGTIPAEEEHQQRPVTPVFSDSSLATQASDTVSPSPSKTAIDKKSSKSKMKVSPSRSLTKNMSVKKKNKDKVPNVMRASIVDPENQIIPPLPRLSIREDTAEKLSRVLTKFDSISVPQDEWTPPTRRKHD